MNKDKEIKITLNLEKLVKDSKNEEKIIEKEEVQEEIKNELNREVIKTKEEKNELINKEKDAEKYYKNKKYKANNKININKNEIKKNQIVKNKKKIANKSKTNEGLEDSLKILNKHKAKLEEERKPRVGKTLDEVKKEKIEEIQEEKEKKITIKNIFNSIALIVVIIAVYLLIEYAPILGIRLPSKLSKEINVNVVSSDNDIHKVYNDELLVYSNHIISTYNKNGKKTWEYSIDNSFNPEIYIYKDFMAISNNSKGIIYLFNEKKEILNMKVDGKIEHIYIDDKGNMAVEYATNSYKKIIGVYDKKGNNKYNTYMEYNAIIDIVLLNNASKLLIIQADSNSFKVGCSINILDGTIEQQNIKQVLKLDNCFIYDVKQLNNNLILLLDNKIIKFNIDTYEQEQIKEFDSSQILFVSLLDNYYVSIEKYLDNTNKYNIITKDYNNIDISSIDIENAPRFVVNSKNLNYCIFQNSLKVVNKWGIEVLSKEFVSVPKDIIIFNNNKSAALIYTNKIQIINL